ncbi:transferase, partial [Streptomyces luteogriseus]
FFYNLHLLWGGPLSVGGAAPPHPRLVPPFPPSHPPQPGTWSAETVVDLLALAAPGVGTWDLRLRIRFRDGASRDVTAHALTGAGLLRRRAVPSARHGVVLVQPYTTHSGALALRVAPGVRGVLSVVRTRLRRLLH